MSAGQGKFAGQRPTFYHCATQPTSAEMVYHDIKIGNGDHVWE